MNKVIAIIGITLLLGLLLWNVYLVNQNENLRKENKVLDVKFKTQQGEIDILTYDLVTTRDSVRILVNSLDSIPTIQKEFY